MELKLKAHPPLPNVPISGFVVIAFGDLYGPFTMKPDAIAFAEHAGFDTWIVAHIYKARPPAEVVSANRGE